MEQGKDMHAVAFKREPAPSLKDQLIDSFSEQQARVLERAVANVRNFVPSYWTHQFLEAGFTPEQTEVLVDTFVSFARGQ